MNGSRISNALFASLVVTSILEFDRPLLAQQDMARFDDGLIRIEATINEQPGSLFLDTGASMTALFDRSVKRLGIATEAKKDANIGGEKVASSTTEPIDISMFGMNLNTKMLVLPFVHRCDGILGWRTVRRPLLIDGYDRNITMLTKLPAEDSWQKWELDKNSKQLFFTVTENGKPLGRVFVDTGVAAGLRLSPKLWDEWKKNHPEQSTTLEEFRYVVGDPFVSEVAWTEKYQLGDLTFHDLDIGTIPTAKDGVAIAADGREFIASIGMASLRHLRFLISPKTNEVWTQSISGVRNHNRLGAVFLPSSEDESKLICHVAPNSPAEDAGLKNGDILVQVDGQKYSGGNRSDLYRLKARFRQPAGTTLKIDVQRGESVVKTQIELRDLLP